MKAIILNWFITVMSLLLFTITLLLGNIPLAILMVLIFAGCGLWFSDLMVRWDKRRQARKIEEAKPEDDICIDIPLDETCEHTGKVESREIKPGRYQSKTYLKMVKGGGSVYENRSEDQTVQA